MPGAYDAKRNVTTPLALSLGAMIVGADGGPAVASPITSVSRRIATASSTTLLL
jgi:hypothetical protein